ncbi:MAG: hypothetical protein HQK55_09580 [Deltaproteobacteria bacterium]|nr:hypothetical protein [Deltaproteobacteria bacterium]
MKGSIHSDQVCPLCGSRFKANLKGLVCPKHPKQAPTKFKIIFGNITRRFESYREADTFLTGLRYRAAEETFDERDYQVKEKPLAFDSLADQWLTMKERTVRPGTFKNLRAYMADAKKNWRDVNIKTISYGQIEDYIIGLPVSAKTKFNACAALKDFWQWVGKRETVSVPQFPEIKFDLGYRQTIDMLTQEKILGEIYRLTYDWNPRVWLAIKWLSVYISIRPGEMISLQEKHLDRDRGLFLIPAKSAKEGKFKIVPMTDDDLSILREIPRGLPHLPFFRHLGKAPKSNIELGAKFSKDYLYSWWRRACKNLGIEGVDLYGGTKHSTAMALRDVATYEEVRAATMHATNKAFERYFRLEGENIKNIYSRKGSVVRPLSTTKKDK